MKLRSKLTVVLLLASTVPMLLVGLIEATRGRQMLEEQIGTDALEFARQTLTRINEYVYSEFKRVEGWSQWVDAEYIDSGDDKGVLSGYLARAVKIRDGYAYVTARNSAGEVVAASNAELMGRPVDDEAEFRQVLRGEAVIRGPIFDPVAGGHVLVISVPVTAGEGSRIIGVLCAAIHWRAINRMIVEMTVGGRKQDLADHFMLTDNDGLVISCFSPAEMFSTNLSKRGMQSSLRAARDEDGYLMEISEHGLPSFSAYAHQLKFRDMPELDWHLVFLQDPDRLFAPVRSLQRTMWYALPIAVAILLAVSILLARRISEPILAVAAAAERVGEGDFDARVSVSSRDELATLADSFNAMASDLARARDRLQGARRKLAGAEEDERRRLALELHDSVGQHAVALNLMLSGLAESVERQLDAGNLSALVAAREQCAGLVASVREVCRALYPSGLETLGLPASLRQLTAQCRNAAFDARVECPPHLEARRFGRDVEIAAFRIAQEAVSNALKHARARHLAIEIDCTDSDLCLTVTDDGEGFAVGYADNDGLGLTSMRQRADAVGGRLTITSRPGQTVVALCAPITDEPPPPA